MAAPEAPASEFIGDMAPPPRARAAHAQVSSIRRIPWLLLAALMLSTALSLLLVYGAR
jgi:hypothetical protein